MSKCLVFLRVSKDNEEMHEEYQWTKLKEKYNLRDSDVLIISEKISAYQEHLEVKREGLKALREEILTGKYQKLYVFELSRFYRRMVKLFHFYFFCEDNGVTIYSYMQPELNQIETINPMGLFMKYSQVLLHGFIAEQESFNISGRTKKSFTEKNGVKYSVYGKKLGRKAIPDNIVEAVIDLRLNGIKYKEIQEEIKGQFDFNISIAKISEILKDA